MELLNLDYKIIFAIIWAIIILIWEIVYIKEIFKWTAKPHPFTWLWWSILTWVVSLAQYLHWWEIAFIVLWFEAIMTFIIFLISLKFWEKKIYKTDVISFIIWLSAILLWYFTKTPLYSVFLITISDILMFIPTIRKTFSDPYWEELFEYYTSSLAYFISFFALSEISLITFFYPWVLIILNWIFIIFTLAIRESFKNIKDIKSVESSKQELYKITLDSVSKKNNTLYIFERYNLSKIIWKEKSENIRKLILKNNIKVYQISNSKKFITSQNLDSNFLKNINILFLDKKIYKIKDETLLFDDKSVYYNFKNNILRIINNKNYTQWQKQLFKVLWNSYSKKIKL